jgi:hypothetical protein
MDYVIAAIMDMLLPTEVAFRTLTPKLFNLSLKTHYARHGKMIKSVSNALKELTLTRMEYVYKLATIVIHGIALMDYV